MSFSFLNSSYSGWPLDSDIHICTYFYSHFQLDNTPLHLAVTQDIVAFNDAKNGYQIGMNDDSDTKKVRWCINFFKASAEYSSHFLVLSTNCLTLTLRSTNKTGLKSNTCALLRAIFYNWATSFTSGKYHASVTQSTRHCLFVPNCYICHQRHVTWCMHAGAPIQAGGHSHVRGIWVCAALTFPLSGSSTAPEFHLFTPSSLLMPSIFCFLTNLAFLGSFLSDFGNISAPNTLILAKICSQDPSFVFVLVFREKNLFCRPYF